MLDSIINGNQFCFFKDSSENRTVYTTSDRIGILIGYEIDEII